jgi:hypothetical protein
MEMVKKKIKKVKILHVTEVHRAFKDGKGIRLSCSSP